MARDPNELNELFRRHGLRATPQRQAVIEQVCASKGHLTVESVFCGVRAWQPTISLKTVYETLHCLVAVGALQELVVGPGPTRYDVTARPHHHLICLGCNRIEDIDLDVASITLPSDSRFSVLRLEVTAWGRCPECEDPTG